jgi:hypothetical protein
MSVDTAYAFEFSMRRFTEQNARNGIVRHSHEASIGGSIYRHRVLPADASNTHGLVWN